MSKAFSAFYDHLLPELPGCTTKFLDTHLLQVARDFCTHTNCWRGTFPTITALDSTLTYFLVTPEAKSELVKLLKLTVGSDYLWSAYDARRCEEVPRFPPDEPPFSIDAANQQITLNDQPSGDIVIEGSIRPVLTATSLPDFLLNDHLEALRAGVLSRLMAMGGKKWTDRQMAVFYAGEYTRRQHSAAAKAFGNNTRRPLRTRQWG